MTSETSLPAVTRGRMLRWGGIVAGLITGYVSLMMLTAFGLPWSPAHNRVSWA